MRIKTDLPLIRKVRKIAEKSKFNFVTERVHFWIDGDDEEITEVDVCVIQGNQMYLFECKSAKLKNRNDEVRRKKDLISAIESKSVKKIVNDSKPKLTKSQLDDVDDFIFVII